MATQNQTVKSPSPYQVSPYQVGPSTTVATQQKQIKDMIQAVNSEYDIAANSADASQFANTASAFFARLRNEKTVSAGTNFNNDLEYLQAAVRNAKGTAYYSAGTSNIGDMSMEDFAFPLLILL